MRRATVRRGTFNQGGILAFHPLAGRLSSLPLVICGPILRRVIPNAVTVWIATREAATVTLTVYDGDKPDRKQVVPPPPGVAQRATTSLGQNLHMVAVTARAPADTLKEGIVYCYDLTFDFKHSGKKTLHEATGITQPVDEIVYAPSYTLPSFALPPSDLGKLRIIHGSCRKPNGGSKDMLALLDDLIAASVSSATERPHQLLMTGDQIYADEVADILLLMLTDAGDTLLGWQEFIPGSAGGGYLASSLPPGTRGDIIEGAGLTSDDRRSHLMSLGEYLAMHLFAWSPVLWPKTLPTFDDVKAHLPQSTGPIADESRGQVKHVQTYADTIVKVRRALANVPSYMICDDHEITDDWNMTREFCEDVYGNPFGMRLIQNGLVAFSLCQAWGNTPEQFEDDPQNPAGKTLLGLLSGGSAYAANSPKIQTIVGLHDAHTLAQQTVYGVYHDAGADITVQGVHVNDGSLHYHYSVEGPAHQVIVTDTRTWRVFPEAGKVMPPDLLSATSLVLQLSLAPSLNNRLQFVVVTTNMPPIPSIRRVAVPLLSLLDSEVYEHDLYDSWEMPSAAFDRMIVALSNRLPLDTSNPPARSGHVIVLSGDVHSSYASRLAYWATKRYGDPPDAMHAAKVVFAQLVASGFKNQNDMTLGQHEGGYAYAPNGRALVPNLHPEGFLGWALDPQSTQQVEVGTGSVFTESPDDPGTQVRSDLPPTVKGTQPSLGLDDIEGFNLIIGGLLVSKITRPPDYRYRLEQVLASAGGQFPASPPTLLPVGTGTDAIARFNALLVYTVAAAAYRNYKSTAGRGKQIVGRSSLSEITLSWGAGDAKQVHHTVRWFEDKTNAPVSWARFTVSLALNDPALGPVKYPGEP